jgi:hypothetical protein
MTVTFVRWKDACQVEASDFTSRPATPEVSELCEVGFLLAENEAALLIGMEQQADDTHPGRWRLNIPKAGIIERRDMEVDKAFPDPPAKSPKFYVSGLLVHGHQRPDHRSNGRRSQNCRFFGGGSCLASHSQRRRASWHGRPVTTLLSTLTDAVRVDGYIQGQT